MISPKGNEIQSAIFEELSDRYTKHLTTSKIHLRWDTALELGKTTILFSIPVQVHRKDDPEMQLPWDFEAEKGKP